MKISDRLNGFLLMVQKFLPKKQSASKLVDCRKVEELKKPADFCNELTNFDEIEKKKILEDLALVQSKLEHAHVVFNFQTNIDLIESSIYYIESLESKYSYLIKQARKMQLKCALKSV